LGGAFRGPEWHAVPGQRAIPTRGETIGGEQRDGLNVRELSDIRDQIIEIHVKRFHVDFPALGTVLTVGIQFDSDLEATWYTFDLRTIGGVLLWREDSHPGHEAEDGGSHHQHIGPTAGRRVTASPVTREYIATKVVTTHVRLS